MEFLAGAALFGRGDPMPYGIIGRDPFLQNGIFIRLKRYVCYGIFSKHIYKTNLFMFFIMQITDRGYSLNLFLNIY